MSRSETLTITATDSAGNKTSQSVVFNWSDPVTKKMMVGVEKDGTARAAWNVIRAFNQGEALNVPASMKFCVSYTPTLGTGWSTDQTKINALKANLQALPDRPGLRVCAFHEPEDNYTRTTAGAAKYIADQVVFEPLVRSVNQNRKNPLIPVRIFMAYSLASGAFNTKFGAVGRAVRKVLAKVKLAATAPSLNQWVVNMGDDVELGLDVYSIGQIGLSVNFAKAQGKTLCIPEMGPLSAVPHNDDAILSYMQQGIPAFQAAGATWLAWFDKNGSGADLDQYPKALAYLKGQIA